MGRHLNLDMVKVLADLAQFKTETVFWSRKDLFDSSEERVPHIWWQAHCTDAPLCPIASRLLSLSPTSGECERVWSGFGRCHTKKRNRLKNEKVAMEVSIQMNMQYLDPTAVKKRKTSCRPLRPSTDPRNDRHVVNDTECVDTDSDSDSESDDEGADSGWDGHIPSSSSEEDEEELDAAPNETERRTKRRRESTSAPEINQRQLRPRR